MTKGLSMPSARYTPSSRRTAVRRRCLKRRSETRPQAAMAAAPASHRAPRTSTGSAVSRVCSGWTCSSSADGGASGVWTTCSMTAAGAAWGTWTGRRTSGKAGTHSRASTASHSTQVNPLGIRPNTSRKTSTAPMAAEADRDISSTVSKSFISPPPSGIGRSAVPARRCPPRSGPPARQRRRRNRAETRGIPPGPPGGSGPPRNRPGW